MGNLNITQLAASQNNKETTINSSINEVDLALTDNESILVTNSNARTITATEWTRNSRFAIGDGSPVPTAAITITVPATIKGIFVVSNLTSFNATIEISAQPLTSPVVEPGFLVLLTSDGVNILAAAISTGANTLGTIPLNLGSLREIVSNDITTLTNHGGILTSNSTPSYARVNGATDKALRINWPLGNVDEVQFPPVIMPPDLNEANDLTVHVLARMNGATDTPTIDIQVFDAIGDTEMGGATAALSSTLAELTVTIASANISGNPLGFFNIALVPGTHATDALEIFGAWIEYTKKASI